MRVGRELHHLRLLRPGGLVRLHGHNRLDYRQIGTTELNITPDPLCPETRSLFQIEGEAVQKMYLWVNGSCSCGSR